MSLSFLDRFKMDSVFEPSDFRSLKLEARIRDVANLTGSVVEVLEFQGRRIVVDAPARLTAPGQTVILSLLFRDHPPFSATARAVTVEALGGPKARIVLELVQYQAQSLENIEAVFVNRQKKISEFMKAAKGI